MRTTTTIDFTKFPLPKGMLKSDTKAPSWRTRSKVMAKTDTQTRFGYSYKTDLEFPMWYVQDWGWCVPTLNICHSRRADQSYSNGERTYAVRIATASTVRIGNGPHVLARVTVYVRKRRLVALKKFIEMMNAGAINANQIRDRISTRRANHRSWF